MFLMSEVPLQVQAISQLSDIAKGHIQLKQRFRDRLVFQAHRLLYHSTLGSRVIKKRERRRSVRVNTPSGILVDKSPPATYGVTR